MLRLVLAAGLLSAGVAVCAGTDGSAERPDAVPADSTRQGVASASPRRIVSLVPVATEILFALGAGDRIRGRSRWDDYPPEALGIPDVGDAIRPSVEQVLLQDPDLVILVGGSDNARAVQEMERLGVPLLVVRFNTLADLEQGIGLLGDVVDRRAEAGALWGRVEAELQAVLQSVSTLDRPGVYYDVGYPPAVTVGSGSYLDTLITISGGRNVFHDVSAASPQVSLEAILERDPDLVLYPVGSNGASASGDPAERPGWMALRAVRAGDVRRVPASLLHRLGPRLGEAARVLAETIHPQLAPGSQP